MHLFKYTKIGLILSLFVVAPITGFSNDHPARGASKMEAGYSAGSRSIPCDPYNFYFNGSFIYWQPTQENMGLGLVSDDSSGLDLINGDIIQLDFDYKPGFKLGFGVVFDYDNWDSYLQYTWFRGSHHVSSSLDRNNAFTTLWPAWQMMPGAVQPQYKYGRESWKLRLDIIDWDLARNFYVGEKLTFRPFFGLRAAWIQQSLNVNYRNFDANFLAVWPSTHISQDSNSFGIGPRVGLNSSWMVGYGIRIYANGEADILHTKYTKLRAHQESNVTTASILNINDDDAVYLRAHIESVLGLGWGTHFSNDAWYVDLSADYGFQVFFDQNMFRNFVGDQNIGKSISPNGNLYVHGLTMTLRFDF